jgi:hypothetical protein
MYCRQINVYFNPFGLSCYIRPVGLLQRTRHEQRVAIIERRG